MAFCGILYSQLVILSGAGTVISFLHFQLPYKALWLLCTHFVEYLLRICYELLQISACIMCLLHLHYVLFQDSKIAYDTS